MNSSQAVGSHVTARHPVNRTVRGKRHSLRQEPDRLVLLIQAGWVAIGLITVASFPFPKSVPSPADDQASQRLEASAIVTNPARLFEKGSESIVARTVGHAEGTRSPDGSRTPAYFGHVDPGNGVWNLGSFSFQHCREAHYQCSTPEQADTFQLQRLKTQAETLEKRTAALKLAITLEEELNAIDLANQAPLAALGKPGYSEHLQRAKNGD